MPKLAPLRDHQCCFCTDGPMAFTASSMSRRCWRRRAIGDNAVLRGYGTTRFLSGETFRNGQPSSVAVDIVTMMGGLKIQKATLAGFDWGARTANIIAALWPERCKTIVSVSGYPIGSQEAGKMRPPPNAEL